MYGAGISTGENPLLKKCKPMDRGECKIRHAVGLSQTLQESFFAS